jgi:hypothetical protein
VRGISTNTSVFTIQTAQLSLCQFRDVSLFPIQILSRPVDIKHQHGHGGTERFRFAARAAIGGLFEGKRDPSRVFPGKYALLEIERIAFARHLRGPVSGIGCFGFFASIFQHRNNFN